MKIYFAHKRDIPNLNELYESLKNISNHEFILPHENSQEPYDSKTLFKNKNCDLVIAEVSQPSTGVGIELGWADAFGIKIVCVYKDGSMLSNSAIKLSSNTIEYTDNEDLAFKIKNLNA